MNVEMNVAKAIDEHQSVIHQLARSVEQIELAARYMVEALGKGGKILFMGNGGSAADCQHLAAELVGRFVRERRGLPAIALTTDTSILTAIANDYSFESIFARQVDALCQQSDVVVCISTSGNSRNVLCGAHHAKGIGATVVALTGANGGELKKVANIAITVPSCIVARIQEAHILIGHLWCQWIEDSLLRQGNNV